VPGQDTGLCAFPGLQTGHESEVSSPNHADTKSAPLELRRPKTAKLAGRSANKRAVGGFFHNTGRIEEWGLLHSFELQHFARNLAYRHHLSFFPKGSGVPNGIEIKKRCGGAH